MISLLIVDLVQVIVNLPWRVLRHLRHLLVNYVQPRPVDGLRLWVLQLLVLHVGVIWQFWRELFKGRSAPCIGSLVLVLILIIELRVWLNEYWICVHLRLKRRIHWAELWGVLVLDFVIVLKSHQIKHMSILCWHFPWRARYLRALVELAQSVVGLGGVVVGLVAQCYVRVLMHTKFSA